MKEKLRLATLWQWMRNEKRMVWLEYALLALVILLPLLLPGYILTLDLVFTPSFKWPAELTNTYLLDALLWLFHLVLPGDVIEKIILFLVLLLSGVGMHRLVRMINVKRAISAETWQMAAYFAGIFYMINPFTYSRFMAGQWMVLLGYAMLPFFFAALLKLRSSPSWRTGMGVAAWTFAIVTVSIHHIGIMGVLAGLVFITTVVQYWGEKEYLRHFIGQMLSAGGVVLLASSFWLVPALLGAGSIGQATATFNQADFLAFATSGQGAFGAIGEVVRLQGFWAEAQQLYRLPQSLVPVWGLLFTLLWIIIIVGVIKAWRTHRTLVIIAFGSIVIGIVLAATPLLAGLAAAVPFLSGYREPHKFANLIVFGYSILGAFGAAYLISWAWRKFNEIGGQAVTILCLFLPLAITPTMVWGFAGQLSPQSYPGEWHSMNRTLTETTNGKILFLPWHQYSKYSFSGGRIIANPAGKFFDAPMIVSDQPEFRNVSSTVPNEQKRRISEALKHTDDLPRLLKAEGIHHILLAKEDDSVDYGYLDRLSGVTRVSENDALVLYEVAP